MRMSVLPLADAATSLVPALLIGVAVIGMLLSFRRAAAQRSRLTRVREFPTSGGLPTGMSSLEIPDGGRLPQDDLVTAMRIKPSAKLDDDGNEDFGDPLGLTVLAGTSSTGGAAQRQVMHGSRHGHQVFTRQGLVGDAISPGLGFRKDRSMTVVRVAAPAFEWAARDGRLVADDAAPADVRGIFDSLASSPDVWHDLRGVSGPDGLAVSRGGADVVSGWIYDLWLLERMTHVLRLPALAKVRLSREWRLPYGLTDWKPPIRGLAF
jgi:hypothetical protein